VEAWVGELCRRFGPGPIAVAVEQAKGALVCMLRKYECLHLFPVPSTMSAAMRKALYPCGAKDDPRDADLLVQHRERLRLQWFARLDTKLECEFLERWSSLEELKKVPPAELRKFFWQRRRGAEA
jgi:hypothetical protein